MGTLGRLVNAFHEELFPNSWLRRRFRKASYCPLADVPEGRRVRTTGFVRPLDGRAVEAPLSGRLCVYYSIEVHDIGGRHVNQVAHEHHAIPFLLLDRGTHAVIDPTFARISSAFDHETETKRLGLLDARQAALLKRSVYYRHDETIEQPARLRFREAVLELDELITIFGGGIAEPDPDPSVERAYREDHPMRLRFTGSERFPLLISDDPRTL